MPEPKRGVNRLAIYTAIFLSLVALLAVLSGYTQPPQSDEGTGAHIFQIAIVLLLPAIVTFLATADWQQPGRSARPLIIPGRRSGPRIRSPLLSGKLPGSELRTPEPYLLCAFRVGLRAFRVNFRDFYSQALRHGHTTLAQLILFATHSPPLRPASIVMRRLPLQRISRQPLPFSRR